jgi:tetratricopeptide (TPR) repeat protein
MRRLMLHGILILALAATVPASNGISETRQSFALSAQGRVLFQRGEYPQAADVFRQALASDALPTAAAAEARLYLGRIAEVEGDPSGARAILAALARSPATPPMYRAEAQFHIGRLYMLEGHPQTKPALIKVLEMPGATPEYLGKALLCLGQLAFEEADDSAAEQYLQGALAVLELKPETGAAARLLLGRLALHRRHWSTARNYFSLALGLRLNDPAETAAAHAAALFGRAAAWQAEWNMRAAHGDWRALAAMSGAPMSLCLAAQRRLDAATETTRPTPGSDGLACDFSIWAEAYAGQTDRIHLAECGAFVLFADRFEARPGERRLDFFLDLRPAGLPPEDLKVCAMIYDVNSGRRLAAKVADATSLWGWLRLDMWRYDVSPIRLRVELRTGRRLLGAVEIMAAAPEQSAAPRRQIPVILDAPSGITPLRDWPVSFGVPFAPGALWDADGLRLVNDAGMELPCQKEVTARWAEGGAIRWLRFDALVTPGEGCRVDFAPSRAIPTMPVRIIEKNNLITVDTGAARYVLGTGKSPVKEVLLKDGRRQAFCGPQSRGLYLVTRDGRSAQVAEDSSMQIEARGPVAACVRFEGYYRDPDHDDAPLAGYVTRLEFFAGQANAAITHTLMLAADTGISQLKEVGWEMDCSFVDLEEGAAAPLAAIYAGEMDAGAMPGIIMACRKNARQDFKDLEVQPDRIVLRLLSDGAGEKLNAQSARVKTYEILIAPTAQQPEALSAAVAQAGLQPLPVYAQADPEWICQSRAMGPLCPMRRGKYAAAESKIESLWRARWLPDEHPSGGRHSVADCLDGAGNRRADCSLRHDDLWFACVRAWSRDLRNLAEDATRTCLDDFISHCLVPRKITGLYDPWHIAPVDMGANILPLGWSDCADSIADVAPNLLQFQYLYQIAGDRRGADVLRAFAAGLKTCCYRAASKVGVDDYQRGTGGYSLMMLKALALSYACDYDNVINHNNNVIRRPVIVWGVGPDGENGTSDDITSW